MATIKNFASPICTLTSKFDILLTGAGSANFFYLPKFTVLLFLAYPFRSSYVRNSKIFRQIIKNWWAEKYTEIYRFRKT